MDEITIENWNDFSVLANKLIKFIDDNRIIYRGQSNSNWNLDSSFFRMIKNNPNIRVVDSLQIEEDMVTYFSDRARLFDEIPSYRDQLTIMDWWAFMQHYGAPTRRLDWSLSPYVALFFAIEKHYEQDGALFLFKTDTMDSVQRLKTASVFPLGLWMDTMRLANFLLVSTKSKSKMNHMLDACLSPEEPIGLIECLLNKAFTLWEQKFSVELNSKLKN